MRSASRTVFNRWATNNDVRPEVRASVARWIHCSLSLSMLDVASSRMRMWGLLKYALTKAINWRCPTLSVAPRSRTSWSNPSGKRSTKRSAPTTRMASQIWSSVMSWSCNLTFSRREPLNKNTSCSTTPMRLRNTSTGMSRMSTPSMVIRPFWNS